MWKQSESSIAIDSICVATYVISVVTNTTKLYVAIDRIYAEAISMYVATYVIFFCHKHDKIICGNKSYICSDR